MASTRAATRCRSSNPICWTIASRSVSISTSASNCPTISSPTAPRRWASARGSDSRSAKTFRCSCDIRSISRRSRCRTIWRIVTTIRANGLLAFNPSPAFANQTGVGPGGSITSGGQTATDASGTGLWCYSDGEASLPVRKELASGSSLTSAIGYSLDYNTLDNNKNPTDGLLIDFKQDFAGVGGDVSYLKSAFDAKYYAPLVSDIVGLIHLQGGILNKVGNTDLRMLDQFQMGPNLVRGFAPNGIGPRDLNPFGTQDALGGTKYWGASMELQMPFWFLPKEVGLKGAVYADAGGLYDYQGPTTWAATGEVTTPANSNCIKPTQYPNAGAGTCTGLVMTAAIRSARRSVSA